MRLRSLVAEELHVDIEQVVPEASFADDLKADSLQLVELIMALEEEFGIQIPDEAAESMATVGDALTYLREHMVQ